MTTSPVDPAVDWLYRAAEEVIEASGSSPGPGVGPPTGVSARRSRMTAGAMALRAVGALDEAGYFRGQEDLTTALSLRGHGRPVLGPWWESPVADPVAGRADPGPIRRRAALAVPALPEPGPDAGWCVEHDDEVVVLVTGPRSVARPGWQTRVQPLGLGGEVALQWQGLSPWEALWARGERAPTARPGATVELEVDGEVVSGAVLEVPVAEAAGLGALDEDAGLAYVRWLGTRLVLGWPHQMAPEVAAAHLGSAVAALVHAGVMGDRARSEAADAVRLAGRGQLPPAWPRPAPAATHRARVGRVGLDLRLRVEAPGARWEAFGLDAGPDCWSLRGLRVGEGRLTDEPWWAVDDEGSLHLGDRFGGAGSPAIETVRFVPGLSGAVSRVRVHRGVDAGACWVDLDLSGLEGPRP